VTAVHSVRTPEDRFAEIVDYPYSPAYADVRDQEGGTLRMAYVDAGPADGPVCLLLHGEPSWGFLYRQAMLPLVAAGVRCVVPDLVGFGRSDKPSQVSDHTYARHVEWVRSLVVDALDLRDITLVGQDWGGLIGLRLAAEQPDRFARIVAANTGLPTGDFDMPEIWHQFRAAVQSAPQLDIARFVASGCRSSLSPAVLAAYDAPFPDESFKAGPRAMPGLVPTRPDDPAAPANRAAWERLTHSDTPFLVAFSDGDPITGAMGPILTRSMPGAAGLDHPVLEGAGHFLQEDAGERLGAIVAEFIR
jgi:haloalkane dehalogenase